MISNQKIEEDELIRKIPDMMGQWSDAGVRQWQRLSYRRSRNRFISVVRMSLSDWNTANKITAGIGGAKCCRQDGPIIPTAGLLVFVTFFVLLRMHHNLELKKRLQLILRFTSRYTTWSQMLLCSSLTKWGMALSMVLILYYWEIITSYRPFIFFLGQGESD